MESDDERKLPLPTPSALECYKYVQDTVPTADGMTWSPSKRTCYAKIGSTGSPNGSCKYCETCRFGMLNFLVSFLTFFILKFFPDHPTNQDLNLQLMVDGGVNISRSVARYAVEESGARKNIATIQHLQEEEIASVMKMIPLK